MDFNSEENLFEFSILHYFLWQEAKRQQLKTTGRTIVDERKRYRRLVEVIREDLPHVVPYEKSQLVSIIPTPEIWNRWIKYPTLENVLQKYSSPNPQPRKRKRKKDDVGNTEEERTEEKESKGDMPNHELQFASDEAGVSLTSLRKELREQKNAVEVVETKLAKAEKLHLNLLRHKREKLAIETQLAQLVEEETNDKDDTKEKEASKAVIEEATDPVEEVPADDEEGNTQKDKKKKKSSSIVPMTTEEIKAKLVQKKQKLELLEAKVSKALVRQVHGKPPSESYISWDQRFEQLEAFQKEYGHCDVPLGWKPNPALYYWVFHQRQSYRWKKKKLTPGRIAKLEEIGIKWEVDPCRKPRSFEARVEQCQAFREAHGHLHIPLMNELDEDGNEPDEDDLKFRLWAHTLRLQYQRFTAGKSTKLDKERIRILDEIGFDWQIPESSSEQVGDDADPDSNVVVVAKLSSEEYQFRNRIEQLRKVKEVCGNCNEKKHILSVYPNGEAIYNWIKQQRRQYKYKMAGKHSTLTDERQEMLGTIDFDYTPRKHYTPTTSTKRKLTKMEKFALEKAQEMNNSSSQNGGEEATNEHDTNEGGIDTGNNMNDMNGEPPRRDATWCV
jgi:Helicase associated domain